MRIINLFALLIVLVALSGCGSGGVKSGGAVKFEDGAPLTEGIIYFVDTQSEFSGRIKGDGSYVIGGIREGDGLPPGQYQVYVTFPAILDPKDWPIDEKFTAPATSGWQAEVKPGGKNQFDFAVSRK